MARPKTKFKIELTKEINDILEAIAKKTNTSNVDTLKHALSLYNLIVDANAQNQNLVLVDNNNPPKIVAKIVAVTTPKQENGNENK